MWEDRTFWHDIDCNKNLLLLSPLVYVMYLRVVTPSLFRLQVVVISSCFAIVCFIFILENS